MHNYKQLGLWQKAVALAVEVYRVTATFPASEKYTLVSQVNRAAVSIPSNIAEGAGRNSDKEFVQFLSIAHASSCELATQLLIAEQLGFLTTNKYDELEEKINELQKMNFGLQNKIKEPLTTSY